MQQAQIFLNRNWGFLIGRIQPTNDIHVYTYRGRKQGYLLCTLRRIVRVRVQVNLHRHDHVFLTKTGPFDHQSPSAFDSNSECPYSVLSPLLQTFAPVARSYRGPGMQHEWLWSSSDGGTTGRLFWSWMKQGTNCALAGITARSTVTETTLPQKGVQDITTAGHKRVICHCGIQHACC